MCIVSGVGEKSRAWQEWASEHKAVGRLKEAREGYTRSLSLNPALAPARENLAWLNVQEGRLEDAQKEVRVSAGYSPQRSVTWLNNGLISEKNGYIEEAEEGYRNAVNLDPTSVEAWNRMGVIAFGKKDYAKSTHAWLKVREIQPNAGDYIWNLHWSLKMSGNEAGAAEMRKLLPKEIPMTNNMIQPPEAKVRLGT